MRIQTCAQTHTGTDASDALASDADCIVYKTGTVVLGAFVQHNLPPERVAEVDDFVEFLRLRMYQNQERALPHMTAQASERSFAHVWDNAEDEAYDAL
jgi:hypothetical protein